MKREDFIIIAENKDINEIGKVWAIIDKNLQMKLNALQYSLFDPSLGIFIIPDLSIPISSYIVRHKVKKDLVIVDSLLLCDIDYEIFAVKKTIKGTNYWLLLEQKFLKIFCVYQYSMLINKFYFNASEYLKGTLIVKDVKTNKISITDPKFNPIMKSSKAKELRNLKPATKKLISTPVAINEGYLKNFKLPAEYLFFFNVNIPNITHKISANNLFAFYKIIALVKDFDYNVKEDLYIITPFKEQIEAYKILYEGMVSKDNIGDPASFANKEKKVTVYDTFIDLKVNKDTLNIYDYSLFKNIQTTTDNFIFLGNSGSVKRQNNLFGHLSKICEFNKNNLDENIEINFEKAFGSKSADKVKIAFYKRILSKLDYSNSKFFPELRVKKEFFEKINKKILEADFDGINPIFAEYVENITAVNEKLSNDK